MEELVPEWGWRRDKGNWFQRQGEASDQWFLERMMSVAEQMTDEERVLRGSGTETRLWKYRAEVG